MNLSSKETKTQLYLRDDNKFGFIKKEIEHNDFIDKKDNEYEKAWPHFYSSQIFFPGHAKIPAAVVTICFARDIIFDPFDKIKIGTNVGEKPDKNDDKALRAWVASKATSLRQTYSAKRKKATTADMTRLVLLGIIILEGIIWGVNMLKGLI